MYLTNIERGIKRFIYGTLPFGYLAVFKKTSPELKYRRYFMKHGYTRNPYLFARRYAKVKIDVFIDKANGLRYVLHRSGRRLYYPRNYSVDVIQRVYKAVLMEQDVEHPHHYVDSLEEFRGKILLDVGTAEGFTSLDAIDIAEKVYLFECDPQWLEALKVTFAPWKEKVIIVERFVSSICNETCISLNDFFKDRPMENVFLKMDIEGAECDALNGARSLFSKAKNMRFAICTYHRKNDAKAITNYLREHNCTWSVPEDLFYVKHAFRTCLVRGQK